MRQTSSNVEGSSMGVIRLALCPIVLRGLSSDQVGRRRMRSKARIDRLITLVQDPEAEINVVIGHFKLIQFKTPPKRIAVSKPAVADVELLTDQSNTRLLNIYGRSFGTTTITFWDENDVPLTFLVRVTIDTLDLEARLRQVFPGAVLHIRQVGQNLILEGQVPDAKTMKEVTPINSVGASFDRPSVGRKSRQCAAAERGRRRSGGGWRWRRGDQCQLHLVAS